MFDAFIGDVGVLQRQLLQPGQLVQVRQAHVSERSVAEIDLAKRSETCQRAKTGSFDERMTEIQAAKIRQRSKLLERGISEQCVTEIQRAERPEARHVRGAELADFGVAKTELLEL